MNWNKLVEKDYSTYPNEGITVLVSDGKNYDVAWFLMSSSYVWMKTNIQDDEANVFNGFKITKWSYITEKPFELKPLELKLYSDKSYGTVYMGNFIMFRIEQVFHSFNDNYYKIDFTGIVPKYLLGSIGDDDVIFLKSNKFEFIEDAFDKCVEIVETYIKTFIK